MCFRWWPGSTRWTGGTWRCARWASRWRAARRTRPSGWSAATPPPTPPRRRSRRASSSPSSSGIPCFSRRFVFLANLEIPAHFVSILCWDVFWYLIYFERYTTARKIYNQPAIFTFHCHWLNTHFKNWQFRIEFKNFQVIMISKWCKTKKRSWNQANNAYAVNRHCYWLNPLSWCFQFLVYFLFRLKKIGI